MTTGIMDVPFVGLWRDIMRSNFDTYKVRAQVKEARK
jgi:hypothetical protein